MKKIVSVLAVCLAFGIVPGMTFEVRAGMLDDENVGASPVPGSDLRPRTLNPTQPGAAAAKDDPKKGACMEAMENAEKNPNSSAASDAVKQKCLGADYTTAAPQGSGEVIETASTPTSAKEAMFSSSLTGGTAPENARVVDMKASVQSIDNVGDKLDDLMDTKSILRNDRGAANSVTDGRRVQTTRIDAQAYRNAQGKATVAIGGDNSPGFDPSANRYESMRGGSVRWDDSLIKTDVETSRAVRFGESELSPNGTNYTGFNRGTSVPENLKRLGLNSAQLEMASYIDARGRDLGMPADVRRVAIATAMRESRFNPFINANQNGEGAYRLYVDSSANGLGQYLNGTWMNQFDPSKKGEYVMNDGSMLNRNNTTNQIDVLFNDINERYNRYSASTAMQNRYNFAQYDYIHHYAGGFGATQDRINFAVNYTNRNATANNAVADYVMGTTTGGDGGMVIPGSSGSGRGGGLGQAAAAAARQISGGAGGGIVQDLVRQVTGGNDEIGTLVNQVLAGNTNVLNGSSTNSMLTAIAVQQLMNKISNRDSRPRDNSARDGDEPLQLTQQQRERVQKLADNCGEAVPDTADEIISLVNRCRSRSN